MLREDKDVNCWVIAGVRKSCTEGLVKILNKLYKKLSEDSRGPVTFCGLLLQELFNDSASMINQLANFLKKCAKRGLKKMYVNRQENVYVATKIILAVVTRLVKLRALHHDNLMTSSFSLISQPMMVFLPMFVG